MARRSASRDVEIVVPIDADEMLDATIQALSTANAPSREPLTSKRASSQQRRLALSIVPYRDAFFEALLFTKSLGFSADPFTYHEEKLLNREELSLLFFSAEAWYESQEPSSFALTPVRVSIAMQGILRSLLGINTQLTLGSVVYGDRTYFPFTKDDLRRSLPQRAPTRSFHAWLTTEGLETIEFTFSLAIKIASGSAPAYNAPTVATASQSSYLHPLVIGRDILPRLGAAHSST